MAATPLGSLLSDTWSFTQKHWMPLAVGAVVFGLVMGVFQVNLRNSVSSRVGMMMEDVGMNADKMQDALRNMQAGDEEAMEEFGKQVAGMEGADVEAMMRKQAKGAFSAILPAVGLSALVSFLVSIAGMAYFLGVALKPEMKTADAAKQAVATTLPLLGLWVWAFLRSFAWIPFIGVIFAIYYMPRFIAAPLYLVEQKKGVLESVTMSIAATKFYWGKIIGNAIVLGVIFAVISIVVGAVIGMVVGGSAAALVMAVVSQFLAGVGTVFGVQLAKTVMHNPIHA